MNNGGGNANHWSLLVTKNRIQLTFFESEFGYSQTENTDFNEHIPFFSLDISDRLQFGRIWIEEIRLIFTLAKVEIQNISSDTARKLIYPIELHEFMSR